jgi:hypothetical protein
MELIACRCDVGYGLPHDHYMGFEEIDGVWQNRQDTSEIGRAWIDWKAVARAQMEADSGSPLATA